MTMSRTVHHEGGLTDGEGWTREQLETLRRGRFTPAPCVRFLHSAFTRAAAVRGERPELAAQARLWSAIGGGAWAVAAGLGAEPFRRRIRSGLAWWSATSLMLDWHLGMLETDDGRPRMLVAADAMTLSRAWLVPVAADSPTPLVLGIGAATDVMDGVLARRVEPTRAGRDLEGLVDTSFSLAALAGLVRQNKLGRGAAIAEGARLAIGAGLPFHSYFADARPPERRLAHAARSASVVRFAAVLAAASGRRRLGEALVVVGAAASVALGARAASAQSLR